MKVDDVSQQNEIHFLGFLAAHPTVLLDRPPPTITCLSSLELTSQPHPVGGLRGRRRVGRRRGPLRAPLGAAGGGAEGLERCRRRRGGGGSSAGAAVSVDHGGPCDRRSSWQGKVRLGHHKDVGIPSTLNLYLSILHF